jgi:hypothetical protein
MYTVKTYRYIQNELYIQLQRIFGKLSQLEEYKGGPLLPASGVRAVVRSVENVLVKI